MKNIYNNGIIIKNWKEYTLIWTQKTLLEVQKWVILINNLDKLWK